LNSINQKLNLEAKWNFQVCVVTTDLNKHFGYE